MSFEIKTDTEGNETLEETVPQPSTRRIWTKNNILNEIAKLEEEIAERQARKGELEAQIVKFTKEVIKE